MWSLFCAVGLIAVVAIGDPQAIQMALTPPAGGSELGRPGPVRSMIAAADTRFDAVESIPVRQNTPAATTEDHRSATPIEPTLASAGSPLRVASSNVANLNLDRDHFSDHRDTSTASGKRSSHGEMFRPHPEEGNTLTASVASIDTHRRVPDPLLDPFDEPPVVETSPIDEQRIVEIATLTIDERLAELRAQVFAAYRPRQQPIPPLTAPSPNDRFHPPRLPGEPTAPSPVTRESGLVAGTRELEVQSISVDASTARSRAASSASLSKPQAIEIGNGRFRLDVADASVVDVLRLIGEIGNTNIVASESVEGTVRCNLTNVTLDEALDALARVHSLSLERAGSIIFVSAADDVVRRDHRLPIVIPREACPSRANPGKGLVEFRPSRARQR